MLRREKGVEQDHTAHTYRLILLLTLPCPINVQSDRESALFDKDRLFSYNRNSDISCFSHFCLILRVKRNQPCSVKKSIHSYQPAQSMKADMGYSFSLTFILCILLRETTASSMAASRFKYNT